MEKIDLVFSTNEFVPDLDSGSGLPVDSDSGSGWPLSGAKEIDSIQYDSSK